ncbi:YETS2-like protein [Mya arenaria]|uniref:YETS2-like protein n=1 Tax=Mya arenaria TaxID=6604 RepID=A0ABY7EFY1_MYAAR|nr:YETS2-like protein [Mya arenaria]
MDDYIAVLDFLDSPEESRGFSVPESEVSSKTVHKQYEDVQQLSVYVSEQIESEDISIGTEKQEPDTVPGLEDNGPGDNVPDDPDAAKAATQKKIKSIIDQQFSIEVSNKETELLTISERLEVARSMMDRLRACIVASYYGKAGQQKTLQRNPSQPATIHPSVRKYIGKAPPGTPLLAPSQIKKEAPVGINTECKQLGSERVGEMTTHTKASVAAVPVQKPAEETDTRTGRFKQKRRIIVGNVSKSIPADQRDENDQATHKWMVYVRGPKERPNISDVVKKVWFFLHPSYRPNDLVEVRTYTGLQTLGSETIVDVEIEKDVPALPKPLTACIKKEPGTEDMTVSEANITTCVKTEPQDDYECRVTENGGLKRKLLGQGLSGEARQEPSSPEMSPMLASMLLTTSWQRASSVRQYLRTYLTDSTFHGEPLWTTKQILTWCRIHSYSPHYLERPLHPTSIDLQAETSLISDKQHKHFHSVSNSNSVLQEVTSQQNMMTSSSPSSDSGEEEVDIISTEVKKPVVKQDEPEQTSFVNSELLPSPTGASFVEHAAQKIGVNFSPTEVVSGYHGNVSHGTVYRAMEQFMEDLLRETFALQVNMGRYPDTLGVADVFAALQHLPCADFLTNKFLGVSESTHTLADR